MEQILTTRGLTKSYRRKTAVDNVSLTVNKGEIYGFIGKNGAGKTTLMRMVAGTSYPNSGEIELFGAPVCGESRARVGALIETPALYPNKTARENMRLFGILTNSTEGEISEILEMVGLSDTGKKKVKGFSLGMRQRLGIALALLGNPDMLLLDEPVNGLDPAGIKDVRDLILKLNRERGVTVFISSHLLDELSRIATRYGIIDGGRLIEEISVSDLMNKCRKKLLITVDNAELALKLLENEERELAPDGRICVYTHMDEASRMNTLLVVGGVAVGGIESASEGLEDYFIERVGG